MSSASSSLKPDTGAVARIDHNGYATLAGVFSPAEVRVMWAAVETALADGSSDDPAIRGGEGTVYAARNLLEIWPGLITAWHRAVLVETLTAVLGRDFGLVRVLYFDKPPGNSWALPWHKDLTIAVRNNRLPSERFGKPTRKAGVPHVEAPREVLEGMLTARIHLDPVTDENGPLKVVPGSHRTGKALVLEDVEVRTLHAKAGDVLLV